MSKAMQKIALFLMELDAPKSVERRSYTDSGQRLENSAEHSWHLAMACWNIANAFDLELNQERLLQLALAVSYTHLRAHET